MVYNIFFYKRRKKEEGKRKKGRKWFSRKARNFHRKRSAIAESAERRVHRNQRVGRG